MHLTQPDRKIMYGIVLPGPDVEDGVPIVKGGDVRPERLKLALLKRTTREIEAGYARSRLRAGDLVYAIRGSIGDVAIVPHEVEGANLTQDAARVAPRAGVVGRWLLHTLNSSPVSGLLESRSTGATVKGINIWDLKRVLVPVPPLRDQEAIANFLDAKTATIDALIEKKQRLIDLLTEKRAALIHQAVTKGLDPNVPMKDSGIPWIGEIPAHWTARPLYAAYNVQLGKMLNAAVQTGGMLAPYLRNANIQWDRIGIEDVHMMDFSPSDRLTYALEPGDILMCEGGANEKIVGKSAIWLGQLDECYYQKALHRIRALAPAENPRFLLYGLWAAFSCGAFVADASANIYHLTAEKLRVMRFPCAAPTEQNEIVSYVDRHLDETRKCEQVLEKQIQKLKEYRQSLITAAVTGQLPIPDLP